ncbi:HypC/HybG/HupF family hydrogenase formation chaperone [Raineyella sp.]|uniref:HypC/HybG/HupF family hydrogenase formation chaperone n=1 Tax=Raineyella sp. TaxID=1911550 RepID=UPI002B20634C|nr:HypC/HybG/HupF family hydrogenase formation chaperone [Raineyella sp.]MEA5153745.1 HypC/HybG/HupF family hydrogenase formation chaperone [Raineyella sp.]
MSVPSRIVRITPGVLPMADVRVADREVSCCLAYVPEAEVGDFVLVQNGFAIELLDPESAAQSWRAFAELGVLEAAGPDAGVDASRTDAPGLEISGTAGTGNAAPGD